MSFSSHCIKYVRSYKEEPRKECSSSLSSKSPFLSAPINSPKAIRYFAKKKSELPKINSHLKKKFRASQSSFEGSVKLNKSSFQYSCIKNGQKGNHSRNLTLKNKILSG